MTARTLLTFACIAALAVAVPVAATAARPLQTAISIEYPEFYGRQAGLALARVRAAGATAARMILPWGAIAPGERPPGFDPEDPADAAYNWEAFDARVRRVVASGLQPILAINQSPPWAWTGRDYRSAPKPLELRRFMRAAAVRYSGRFQGLPRVRYWQVWIEPNLSTLLRPQLIGRRPVAPQRYREMVNEVATAVHSVHRDNVVIAGGLAPFRDISVRQVRWGPLTFMRSMLCLSRRLRPTCRTRVNFDVWSHHPYTSGGPTHHANLPDDVSLGDLPEMRRVLRAAIRARHVVSARPVGFWVTEFSWDTSPPDPQAVPVKLHARWVAEALYVMWRNGVSLVTWLQLRDEPFPSSFVQSGLYFRRSVLARDKPKPALTSFRFPFVAYRQRRGIFFWGRTPSGRPGTVHVEQTFPGGWRRIAVARTDRNGIFSGRAASRAKRGYVRARVAMPGGRARPFALRRPPDRFYNAFGSVAFTESQRGGRPDRG